MEELVTPNEEPTNNTEDIPNHISEVEESGQASLNNGELEDEEKESIEGATAQCESAADPVLKAEEIENGQWHLLWKGLQQKNGDFLALCYVGKYDISHITYYALVAVYCH